MLKQLNNSDNLIWKNQLYLICIHCKTSQQLFVINLFVDTCGKLQCPFGANKTSQLCIPFHDILKKILSKLHTECWVEKNGCLVSQKKYQVSSKIHVFSKDLSLPLFLIDRQFI